MRIVILISLIFLSGCLTNDTLEAASIANNNVYKLRQLCYGMSEEEVFARMKAPSRQEKLLIKKENYDIWFYLTRGTVFDQEHLVHRNLTPVIFKEGLLIGTGYTLYDKLIYQASLPNQEEANSEKERGEQENKPYLDEEDIRMLQEEEEEDFNNR